MSKPRLLDLYCGAGGAAMTQTAVRVVIESPFKAATARLRGANVRYARACLKHSLSLGESPFASHLLYPQVLDDDVPAEREQGIAGQLAWLEVCDLVAVYDDRGISAGMQAAIDYATKIGKPILYRSIRP